MKKQQIERICANPEKGLSSAEVQLRKKQKLTNKTKKSVGKSYLQILASNVLTFFNLLGLIIFVLMLICRAYSDMLFVVVILANTVIGIFQEVRSKLAVEKLSVVNEPVAEVMRDGKKQTISTFDVVLDDIVLLSAGKQICCDCVITSGEIEVNESMLTGESLPVKKRTGDALFAGSFVVSGSCTSRAEKVGKECYAEKLSEKIKKAKTPDSKIIGGVKLIIKIIAIFIFPLGIATFLLSPQLAEIASGTNIFAEYVRHNADIVTRVNNAIRTASGSMIGMVPSGMVLLTGVALALSAFKLANRNVLVRELPCIEMLARVNTICLDKTGTITDGSMSVEKLLPIAADENTTKTYLATLLAATQDKNATASAISSYLGDQTRLDYSAALPFSSEKKYSAVQIDGVGTVALGAPEFMFDHVETSVAEQCENFAKHGLRVLAVGISKKQISDGKVTNLKPVALVVLADTVRADAPKIIGWFAENHVDVKVISGDNPLSVSVIAASAGVPNADKYVSLEGMTDEQVIAAATQYTVFGRVTPEQKALIISALKAAGKTVAMTGDGVNDILAMRESDCAISVGSGTDAAKTVANLVLTDDKFSSLPKVVAEGRQVVNNIQNSATLFLTKTIMTVLLTILTICLPSYDYPFTPANLYAIELFVIGIPSFLLTFKPNNELIKGNFLKSVLLRSLPGGLAMFLSVAFVYVFGRVMGLQSANGVFDRNQLSTVAMFAMTFTGLANLWLLLLPVNKFNAVVGAISTVGTGALFLCIEKIFNGIFKPSPGKEMHIIYHIPNGAIVYIVLAVVTLAALAFLGNRLLNKSIAKTAV